MASLFDRRRFVHCAWRRARVAAAVFAIAMVGLAAFPIRAAEFVATKLDGTSESGELTHWDLHEIVLEKAGSAHRLDVATLMSLRPAGDAAATNAAAPTTATAEFVDGTQIPIAAFQISGKTAQITPAGLTASAESKSLSVPVAQLAAVRFIPLDEGLAAQWSDIRAVKSAGDLVVAAKREGKSLDYVEGVLGDITNDKVDFKLDGDAMQLGRGKVAAIVFHRTNQSPAKEAKAQIDGRSGLRAAASEVEFRRGSIAIKTAGGLEFEWPLDDLAVADFSTGKVRYLSDLESQQKWSPLVDLPQGTLLANAYGQPRRDRSAFGGKLTLKKVASTDAVDAAPSRDRVQIYSKGLALHSQTELEYRLPVEFRRFQAVAGIDPLASSAANVRLVIMADGRTLLETELSGDGPSQPIDVEIRDAKRLKILVDFGKNLDTGDWLNLCDAKIVK